MQNSAGRLMAALLRTGYISFQTVIVDDGWRFPLGRRMRQFVMRRLSVFLSSGVQLCWAIACSGSLPHLFFVVYLKLHWPVKTDWLIDWLLNKTSSLAIAEKWPKVEDWNWETIFTNYIGLYSTTATYLASKEIEIGEKKRKIRAITPFKVIQGHPRSSRSIPIESPYATSY